MNILEVFKPGDVVRSIATHKWSINGSGEDWVNIQHGDLFIIGHRRGAYVELYYMTGVLGRIWSGSYLWEKPQLYLELHKDQG